MDLISENSGDNSYQNSLSRGPSLTEKNSLSSSQQSKKRDDFKYTMAYEKGLMKERCGLCKMYFHRNSVNYKVPNHRIFDLERKWNVKREGRRYANAGFLYKMIDVCCFCSQFFKIMPEELPEMQPKEPESKPLKLDLKTVVERTDIAKGQRVYSSSSVDGRTAEMAVMPPYEEYTRTRREVDPWWEIDFSRCYHVHSLSFLVSTGKHQELSLSVFLLNRPVGFEDPFIDSIKKVATASMSKVIPDHDVSQMVPITWTFEPNTTCFAIRVQLKGIHSLAIQKFQVLQGDQLVISTEDDFAQTMNSFSSLSPFAVREGVLEMMSPEEKKLLIRENDPYVDVDERLKESYGTVDSLAQRIKRRKNKIRMWKEKVRHFASIFTAEEIDSLYRVIFKPALEAKPCLADAPPLQENDLLENALIQHYPRCDLTELHTRLRSIVRWIQTRSHLKVLSNLASSRNFDVVANDPNSHLQRLLTAFKHVELYWGKCEIREARMLDQAKHQGFVGVKTSEARGCSWAQFLIVISLFCQHKCKLIPQTAFYLDTIGATSDVVHNPFHGSIHVGSPGDDHSVGSGLSESYGMHSLSLSGGGGGSSVNSKHSGSGNGSGHGGAAWLDRMATPVKFNPPEVIIEKKTFLQKAREVEKFPYYNSSFAEYKFWHFQRRTALQNIDFPPDLSLEFARSLNPKRGSTSQGMRTLPALERGSSEVEGSVSLEGSMTESQVHRDDVSVRSGLSANTPAVGRPNTRELVGTPSRKIRSSPAAISFDTSGGPPGSAGGGGGGRLGTPSGKFNPSASMKMLLPAPSSRNLMSASLSSLDGLGRGSSFILGQGSSSLLRASTKMDLNAGTSSRPQTTGGLPGGRSAKAPSKPIKDDVSMGSSDIHSFSDSEDEGNKAPKPATTIDFFRVCALCELRFPRDCMEMKVMRKHVVALRTKWDPELVSKEIRLLDHTISMYNLVHVCTFCSQFFDPDFPDGIAYPVRVDSPIPKVKSALGAIASQNGAVPLKLHYDTRYVANPIEVGEVFSRPYSVESRARAQRAREIAQKQKDRQAAIEASLSATK